MNPDLLSEVDCCRLCGFVFRDKRRKRNVVGEFAKMFEKVVSVEESLLSVFSLLSSKYGKIFT